MAGSTDFPTLIDSFGDATSSSTIVADHVNDLRRAVEAIENKLGPDSDEDMSSIDYMLKHIGSLDPGHKHTVTNGATDLTATQSEIDRACDSSVNGFWDGYDEINRTRVWLYEDTGTAPTGWSIATDSLGALISDRVLAVKGGAQAYDVNGRSQAGSWQQPNHTLIKGEIPAHYHKYNRSNIVGRYEWGGVALAQLTTIDASPGRASEDGTQDGLQDQAHNHGSDYRPYATVGLLISKDA